MDGVTAFVNGLHWILNYLITSAVLGIVGLTAMAFSAVFGYSKRQNIFKSLILAVTGTLLLIPAMIVGIIYSVGFILNIISNISVGLWEGIQWQWLPLVILGLALPVCVVVYDIKVIRKFIKSRNNKPTEEQKKRSDL